MECLTRDERLEEIKQVWLTRNDLMASGIVFLVALSLVVYISEQIRDDGNEGRNMVCFRGGLEVLYLCCDMKARY